MAAATSPAGEPIPTASNQGGQADTSSSDPKLQPEKLGNLSADIIPQLFKLYDCTATPADYEIYAPKAVFEDPLMQAHGVKQIKSAFYSIPKVFKEAQIVDYTITEEETTQAPVQDGKVVRHEDLWNKNPLWNKSTIKVPLIGRAFEGLRRGNMMFTHLLMGFGKDPHTKK